MSLRERANKLLTEADVLIKQYDIPASETNKLSLAVSEFNKLWDFPGYVNPDELQAALDVIDGEVEDLCLARLITDRNLEARAQDIDTDWLQDR